MHSTATTTHLTRSSKRAPSVPAHIPNWASSIICGVVLYNWMTSGCATTTNAGSWVNHLFFMVNECIIVTTFVSIPDFQTWSSSNGYMRPCFSHWESCWRLHEKHFWVCLLVQMYVSVRFAELVLCVISFSAITLVLWPKVVFLWLSSIFLTLLWVVYFGRRWSSTSWQIIGQDEDIPLATCGMFMHTATDNRKYLLASHRFNLKTEFISSCDFRNGMEARKRLRWFV